MEISIDKLKSNPFRRIDKYPLNKDKIKGLKQSIEETGLWKNAFCVRKTDKKDIYELVFGHHTLQAAKELGFKKVEVIIEDGLSDEVMIKRMANENMEMWGPVTSTVLEIVSVVKEYIEKELNKCNDWEALSKYTKCLFDNDFEFKNVKGKGAGLNTILKFLGKPWKEWQIRDALRIINNEKISINAIEKINNLGIAKETAIILDSYDVDEEGQEVIVDEIQEEIEHFKEDNKEKVNKEKRKEIAEKIIENKGYNKKEDNKREYHKTKELNDKIINNCIDSIEMLNASLIEVFENWEELEEDNKNKLKRLFRLLFRMLKNNKEEIGWDRLIGE